MSSDDKSYSIQGYGKIHFIDENILNFYRRTTILYGASQTGKSTLIYDIMYKLKDIIPNWIVIAPTNKQNKAYDSRIPARCILEDPTVDKIREIVNRQKAAVDTYGKANKMDILHKLANRTGDLTLLNNAMKIADYAKRSIIELRNRNDIQIAEKLSQEQNIKEVQERQLKKIYKKIIEKYRSNLEKNQLTKEEDFTLKYLNFNPSLCLILDDCAAQINLWGKDGVIKELFMNGRHYWTTTIIAMQDDKLLPTDIRKNTFNAIFTDPMNAVAFFENTRSNGIGKTMRIEAAKVIEGIFKNLSSGVRNNKKMVYNREDQLYKFRYVVAELRAPFRVGSKHLWELNDKLPASDSDKNNKDNKYFQAFN